MSRQFPQALRELVNVLVTNGYEQVEQRAPASFGDELVTFSRDAVSIRLVRDRGQWVVEASPNGGEDWYDADTWRAALTEVESPDEPRAADEQARILRDDMAAISAAVRKSPSTLIERLRTHRAARARRRLGLSPDGGIE